MGTAVAGRELYEAQPVPPRLQAERFGVDGHGACKADAGRQVVLVQLDGGAHASLRCLVVASSFYQGHALEASQSNDVSTTFQRSRALKPEPHGWPPRTTPARAKRPDPSLSYVQRLEPARCGVRRAQAPGFAPSRGWSALP